MKIRPTAGVIALAMLPILLATSSATGISIGKTMGAPAESAPALKIGTAKIVLVQQLEDPKARATVIRRSAGTSAENLVLVTAATTPTDLAKAVAALASSRHKRGDQFQGELRAHIAAAKATDKLSKDLRRAGRDLQRLRSAEPIAIENLGTFPAISIRVAPAPPKPPGI